MPKVLVEGYRVSKEGGGLWTGVVGGRDVRTGKPVGRDSVGLPPTTLPKATSAITKPQPKTQG